MALPFPPVPGYLAPAYAGQSQIMFVGMTALIGAGVGAVMGLPLLIPTLVGAATGYVVGLSETGQAGSFLDQYGASEDRLLNKRNVTVLSGAALGVLTAQYTGNSMLLGGAAGSIAGLYLARKTRY